MTGPGRPTPRTQGLQAGGRRSGRTAGLLATVAWVLLLVTWAVSAPPLVPAGEAATVNAAIRAAQGEPWTASVHESAAIAQATSSIGVTPAAERPTVSALLSAVPGEDERVVRAATTPVVPEVLGAVVRLTGLADVRWDRAVVLLRLLAVLLLAPLPLLARATVRRATRSPRAGTVAALAVLGVPQLAQVGSSVTVWAPAALLWGVLGWAAVRWTTGDRGVATAVWTALPAGLLPFVDVSGYAALPVALVVLLVGRAGAPAGPVSAADGLAPGAGRGPRVGRTALLAAAAALLGAVAALPWTVRAFRDGAVATPLPAAVAPSPAVPSDWWTTLTRTFWGPVGAGPLSLSIALVDVVTVLGVVALLVVLVRRGPGVDAPAAPLRVRGAAWTAVVAVLGVGLLLLVLPGRGAPSQLLPGTALVGLLPVLLAGQAAAWRTLPGSAALPRRTGRAVVVLAVLVGAAGLVVVLRAAWVGAAADPLPGIAAAADDLPWGLRAVVLAGVLTVLATVAAVVAVWRATRDDAGPHDHGAPDAASDEAGPQDHGAPETASDDAGPSPERRDPSR